MKLLSTIFGRPNRYAGLQNSVYGPATDNKSSDSTAQLTFICSNLAKETLEKGVKCVQS